MIDRHGRKRHATVTAASFSLLRRLFRCSFYYMPLTLVLGALFDEAMILPRLPDGGMLCNPLARG